MSDNFISNIRGFFTNGRDIFKATGCFDPSSNNNSIIRIILHVFFTNLPHDEDLVKNKIDFLTLFLRNVRPDVKFVLELLTDFILTIYNHNYSIKNLIFKCAIDACGEFFSTDQKISLRNHLDDVVTTMLLHVSSKDVRSHQKDNDAPLICIDSDDEPILSEDLSDTIAPISSPHRNSNSDSDVVVQLATEDEEGVEGDVSIFSSKQTPSLNVKNSGSLELINPSKKTKINCNYSLTSSFTPRKRRFATMKTSLSSRLVAPTDFSCTKSDNRFSVATETSKRFFNQSISDGCVDSSAIFKLPHPSAEDPIDSDIILVQPNGTFSNSVSKGSVSPSNSLAHEFEKEFTCGICLDIFDDNCITLKTCSHIFCKNCFDKWFNTHYDHSSKLYVPCPTCRCSVWKSDVKKNSAWFIKLLKIFKKHHIN